MIDPDTPSKLLVTSRIRGLVKGAAEIDVGSLSEVEALDLLVATAGIDASEWDEEARGLAMEVVNMCGRLALTVAIVGGMVLEFGGHVDTEFVDMLREEGLGGQDDDEEGGGATVEDRVIKSSLAMIEKSGAKKNSEMMLAIFSHFAVFPEDVAVPLDVFTTLTKTVAGCEPSKKATMQIRASLTTLLAYNLLKGSTSAGAGVFMHDIGKSILPT